ncbi:alanine racemase [Echinicola vietnamensis]|uniref:Alanine racemase n=1 Tax=Echinicola vietnamensis (strain DSM 17526 / LMG 23754 / KMM 6221) TaxID=926556 RepID=L0FYT8_ECHVK|nr:alanine racemase [Echinicola vietnamensis]AGA77810.1 alanine racemase [Echinicola vietnamensis DSM 17526]
MRHTSRIEISKSAYRRNMKFIRSQVGDDTIVSAVIKGNAYGHGIENIIKIAENVGIRHFSAFSTDEAKRVLQASEKNSDIMIMGMVDNQDLEWIIKHRISFFVFEFDRLMAAIKMAKKLHIPAKIHVEVETGFHRTGFEWNEKEFLADVIYEHGIHLELTGLCTHFAGAESIANYLRVQNQIKQYRNFKNWFDRHGIKFGTYHTACSAASLSYPETIMDMVRIGILQYGFWPSQETYMSKFKELAAHRKNPLKRLISWKSSIMSIKEVGMGDFVGYGTTFMAHRPMRIALVPVGYCHGFSRMLSNLGKVLIQGKMVSVVGTVTMNSISVDITDLKDVKKGDEVVIIGKQKNNEITVASFSETTQQVNYELLTRLPHDIPRKIVY